MSSQFIRLNCYGAESSHRRRNHENASDILEEASRGPGAAPHVRSPQRPTLLFGESPDKLQPVIAELREIGRDVRGAPLRRGAALLYAVVISYPLRWREFDGDAAWADYNAWRAATLIWLEDCFGADLRSIVEHTDEKQPHIHAFVIPPLSPGNRIDHRLHPGRTARAAALAQGRDHRLGERAYRDGMRAWQQSFYEAVSASFGHDRIGPRRKRFQRDVALSRQASDHFLERLEVIIANVLTSLDAIPGVQKYELETLNTLLISARREHRRGQDNAIELLEAFLAAPPVTESEGGIAHCAGQLQPDDLKQLADPNSTDWVNDEDIEPGHENDDDIGYDDDPAHDGADDDFEASASYDDGIAGEHFSDWTDDASEPDDDV